MATVINIDPAGIYDDISLSNLLGISTQVIDRARRSGALRSTQKGRRVLFLGAWVLDWLQTDEEGPGARRLAPARRARQAPRQEGAVATQEAPDGDE
jgi:hypothetical protein